MEDKIAIVWLRRDIRLEDQEAFGQALATGLPIFPLFIFDRNILDKLPSSDGRISFIYQAIKQINDKLLPFRKGIRMFYGTPAEIFSGLIDRLNIAGVFLSNDYEPYALKRDEEIRQILLQKGIALHAVKDHLIFEKNEIRKDDGSPYTVYTPYKNKWLNYYSNVSQNAGYSFDELCRRIFPFTTDETMFDFSFLPFKWSPGIFKPLVTDDEKIRRYQATRDFPKYGTTKAGVHLRFGTVSIRHLAERASILSAAWLSELIWREFFSQILWHFPYVADHPFKKLYENIPWRNNTEEFERWCAGETGVPIVDAGMRELNETGFMHNRVRMITASYLVKHLLVDWRWGEAYFASILLDFDLASNNGNWQWVAGTGCDAAPYFRIFNPMTQAEKFDPEAEYIRKWVPEFNSPRYLKPMVDHEAARIRCLEAYQSVRSFQ